jgi:manganese/iron transport system substrate-binding protein
MRRLYLPSYEKLFNALAILLMIALPACSSAQGQTGGGRLKVVATTTIIGDVASQVGGDLIDLTVLLPVDSDPHSYDPSPQDAAAVTQADLIFANGLGLETFLDSLLQNTGQGAKLVTVSEGIHLLALQDGHEAPAQGSQGQVDPHVWFDPNNVSVWVDNIAAALGQLDAANQSVYTRNAEAYKGQLKDLDAWIRDQVAQVPEGKRVLASDHTSLGYFAARYGFDQVGAIFPGLSTLSEPSAQELAALEEAIRRYDVPAIFVGTTVNTRTAQRVAQDTGAHIVPLYTGSLSQPDGPAGNYLEFMRYDVNAIVGALK